MIEMQNTVHSDRTTKQLNNVKMEMPFRRDSFPRKNFN